ncbi:serine/threonine-protein phosphatase [candidate division KSB1 bacterium]|nr:serine/threonine-protein phosphatase [bacterium]NUM68424.1 serine/threonine-protein phosphatase [candidate division KSB1 bacterium]
MATQDTAAEPKLGRLLLADVRHGDFKRTLRRDWSELKEFYLDQERKTRLQGMGKFKRFFVMAWWLIKSLFLKLTPVRRVLVVISCVLVIQSGTIGFAGSNVNVTSDTGKAGFIILLFVLMLELKDKMTAQSELAAGRVVQRALMPKRNPVVAGWEIWMIAQPANEVSGDFVDYLALDGERLGLALGDVAGKGLKAALLMVKLQATLRALAAEFDSLAELGAKLNAILRRDGLPDSFASLVYLELQPDSGSVRLLNAGHMPPLRLSDFKLEEIAQHATALGLTPEATFVEQRVELQRGETLLIYSDGLTEARNEAGDFFGEERLFALLRSLAGLQAAEMGARIIAAIAAFVGEAPAHDDLSMLVLQRTAAGPHQ